MKNQKVVSIVIYSILGMIIIALSSFLLWAWYIEDMHGEYPRPYNETCYKVERDENSITMTKYEPEGSRMCEISKTNFKDGKEISEENTWIYKTKYAAKETYENLIKPIPNGESFWENITLKDNVVSFMYFPTGEIDYISEEVKEKVEACTTNEEIINYYFELNEKDNWGLPEEYKRIN